MQKSLPKVSCRLVGEDGNAFAIMGRFRGAARKAGWSQEDIKAVLDDAISDDYRHLLYTISEHCEEPENEEEEDNYDYDG